jgi:hypothetical protein
VAKPLPRPAGFHSAAPPSAPTYLDYFYEGIDGRGTRSAEVDRIIANLARLLDGTGSSTWDEKTESWRSGGIPVDVRRCLVRGHGVPL